MAVPAKRTELGTGAGTHNCAATAKMPNLRSRKGVVVDVEEAKRGEAVPDVGERALQAHVGDVQAGDDGAAAGHALPPWEGAGVNTALPEG